jgi:hypothetical protein
LIIKINHLQFKTKTEFQNIEFNEQQRLSEIEAAKLLNGLNSELMSVAGLVIFYSLQLFYTETVFREKKRILFYRNRKMN